MSFHNVSLPPTIEYGSIFGFGFATIVQTTASGHEYRNARQSQARHRFRPRKVLQTQEEAIELKEFIIARRGAQHSFRLKDWQDFTTNADGTATPTAADVVLGTGDGTTKTFQLLKVYDVAGDAPYTRTITLPVSGTVLVAEDSTPTVAFTVSTAGVVTFTTAPLNGAIITAGCEFDVPVRFASTVDQYAGMRADAYGSWSMDALECVEVLDSLESPERWTPGGSVTHAANAYDVSMSLADGQLHVFQQTASINAYLPAPELIQAGPRIFTVHVKSTATGTVQVRDDSGSVVGSAIAGGTTKTIALAKTSSTSTWIIY